MSDKSKKLSDEDARNLDRDLLDAFLESSKGMDPKDYLKQMGEEES